jgi:hypothetical protein
VFEFLARAIRQEEKKRYKRSKKLKLSLFAHDMILYLKEPKDSTRKILRSEKYFWLSNRI